MSEVVEVKVPPVVLRKFARMEAEIERLRQQLALKDDHIQALGEIVTCLREQVAAHTREHQLAGAIHAADLKQLAKPKD